MRFCENYCKIFAKLCKPCHAYALTIHKFQGSEADTIVYGVSNSKMETWKHVYTAVTRGKKRVVIVGTWENLVAAVRRKSRPRQTALQEKMCKVMSKLKKGEAPVIEEDEPEKDNLKQPSEVDHSTLDQQKFTSIRERLNQLEKERPNIEGKILKNNGMCTSMLRKNLTQKRNNTVMDKQQCNSSSKSTRREESPEVDCNDFTFASLTPLGEVTEIESLLVNKGAVPVVSCFSRSGIGTGLPLELRTSRLTGSLR
mgnify:CR=1 FL=1